MNEQLQGAVAQILERAISGIDSSVEFMQAELPDVIEQLLLWYAAKGVMFFIFGLILLVSGVLIFVKSIKSRPIMSEDFKPSLLWKRGEYSWNRDEVSANEPGWSLVCLSSIAMISFGLGGLPSILDSIQIWIAPKIWLMEYAATLVK